MHKQSANVLDISDIMAINYKEFCGSSLNNDWYFDPDLSLVQGEDFYDSVSPSENIWKKFELLPTPPLSPSRDEDDCFLDDLAVPDLLPSVPPTPEEEWLSSIWFDNAGLKSKLIQDCMWSGSDEEQAKRTRNRKFSLSEVNLVAASVSSVDPTTVTATPPVPKAQNQVEHSYSLAGPEPPRIPMLPTPSTTDDSESEEDVDVVTVDTRTSQCSTRYPTKIVTTPAQIRHDLKAVAAKLTNASLKRPRLEYEFSMPSAKKMKKYNSSSLLSSVSSSDSEEFEGKRSIHNVMERQRRNELKLSLHGLRDILPSLESQEKAPKVVILAHATRYVSELRERDSELVNDLKDLKQRNQYLRSRLEELESRVQLSL